MKSCKDHRIKLQETQGDNNLEGTGLYNKILS